MSVLGQELPVLAASGAERARKELPPLFSDASKPALLANVGPPHKTNLPPPK
jgi:hypothetical protein